MKNFWGKLLSENSEVSSKRFISLIGILILGIGFMADLFWDYKVDESTFNSMETIVEIGMGAIVAEKFSKMRTEKTETVEKIEILEKPEIIEKPEVIDKPEVIVKPVSVKTKPKLDDEIDLKL